MILYFFLTCQVNWSAHEDKSILPKNFLAGFSNFMFILFGIFQFLFYVQRGFFRDALNSLQIQNDQWSVSGDNVRFSPGVTLTSPKIFQGEKI